MNDKCQIGQVTPSTQQLNDIAASIIDTLATANFAANVIKERLFGIDEGKTSNAAEPNNLESRLCLIRTMAQDLNAKLGEIQSRA